MFNKDAESTKTSGFDALLSTYFPSSSANLTVRATEQIDDVVHIFNVEDQGIHTEQSEVKVPMQHLGVGSSVMEDNTVVTVSGIVRFPSNRTQDVICGLAYATIKTYIKSCNDFNGCEYEEPMQYTADELGMFEIAITPGETVLFAVSYDGHDICFAGTDISDGCIAEDLSSPLSLATQDSISTNSFVELEAITGGEYIVFQDVTARTIDVNLYAGACGVAYQDYTMLITPANGCGAAFTVSSATITGSTAR